MKTVQKALALALVSIGALCANAQVNVPSTYKTITIDGSFADWTGVPVAYTGTPVATPGGAIQFANVYMANDQNNLYVRFSLYEARPNAYANTYDNIFVDSDASALTGFHTAGIGSEMLIQWGGGYQERNGGFNEGTINNLGWAIAGSADNTNFEFAISRNATFGSDGTHVFTNDTIAILLEGDNTNYANVEFAPPAGGLVYTFASPPTVLTTNLPLLNLTSSSWQANASGTDLGNAWLDSAYDDSGAPWTSGNGLFGYTPTPGSYPAINTPLTSSGQNTFYFRTHFSWNNLPDNVVFVVTNYLSDGAVYYINGTEVNRVRMPAGTVAYGTSATTTNSPVGHADVFAVPAGVLLLGDNIFEVETHQAPTSSSDMVFGLSLTAEAQYAIVNLDNTQPADRTVNAGNSTTFAGDQIGSGPIAYRWLKNGNTIPGATNATYTMPVVINSDAGSYALVASNPISTNTTRSAVLTVTNTPLSFTDPTLPADLIAVAGQSATFSSAVAGSPPYQFQWFFGGSPILGATNAALTIPFLYVSNSGNYQLSVTNPAGHINSRAAALTVLADTVAPVMTSISATLTQIVVNFSKPLDSVTADNIANYSLSGGVSVIGAAINPSNASQVTLTTGSGLSFGTVYTLTVNGVKDLFANTVKTSGTFARNITIDGSFADWDGMAPIYSGPAGSDGAADFKDIYVYNDAANYYLRVTLWHDIPPVNGQFPYYVNMFYNTDDNLTTGYGPGTFGSEMLIQSGYSYQEKNGGFNEGGINGLNWTSLPASPGTNFEFSFSRSATFASDNTPVFTTNLLSFLFQGMTPGFVPLNQAPASGLISYTNVSTTSTSLQLGKLGIAGLSGGKSAVIWNSPGALQARGSLSTGSWTNVPSATSPYVVPASSRQLFFRLIH
jgi:hypothetical protein